MLVRIFQHHEPAAPGNPAPPPRTSPSAEVAITLQVKTDNVHAPVLAAQLAKAIRAALGPILIAHPEPAVITNTVPEDDSPQRELPRQRSAVAPASRPLLQIAVAARQVVRDNHPLDLTRLEFDLLLFLCQNPHRVHHRKVLMTEVWGEAKNDDSRTVDVHVRRIRSKLGAELPLITTVRGFGYRIDDVSRVRIVDTTTP